MKTAKWIALGVTILSGLLCLLIYCAPWVVAGIYFREAASIGIIGGADGPTAIFVSGRLAYHFIVPIIFVLSLSVWLFIYFKSKG